MSFMREANSTAGSRIKERQRQLEQSRQQTRTPTQTPETKSVVRSRKNQKTKRYQQQEQKLQLHRDREDRRVHDLTEGIRNGFLPSAFNVVLPQCEDPKAELTPERSRMVAGAALCIAALMNAPPWFLDFLIRVPWRKLKELEDSFADGRLDNLEWLNEKLDVPEEERKILVNTRIDSSLLNTVLEFLYQDEYQESVPPMLRLSANNSGAAGGGGGAAAGGGGNGGQGGPEGTQAKGRGVTLESVAALLDGATPLHCASIRGNPAQVNHLLQRGADPTLKTVCGDLPIELVPVCGDKNQQTGHRSCRCMRIKEQEMWECRSGLARTLIFKKCLLNVRMGLVAWFQLIMTCVINWFTMWGYLTCLCSRPIVQKHVVHRQDHNRREARRRAQTLLDRMRQESHQGHSYLDIARKDTWSNTDQDPGGTNKVRLSDGHSSSLAEKAFLCFVRAVHALQSLDLQGDTIPHGFMDAAAPPLETSDCQVLEDEQADLYCCWAESVLLKFRDCRCAGCAALAVQAIRMAHIQVARLFARVEKKQDQQPGRWRAVGQALMRVVHVHICLLLDTEAKQSATRASVWRAEHCLKEWERLRERGLRVDIGFIDECQVHVLDQWAKTADSDLILAEALHGSSLLPSQTMTEVIDASVCHSPPGLPYLVRSITEATIHNLEMALESAMCPSASLSDLARRVTQNAKLEIKAAENLSSAMAIKGSNAFFGAVEKLTEAIEKAQRFPHLAVEVTNAKDLRLQWLRRAEAMERLESIMTQARQPIKKGKKHGKVATASGGGKELQGYDVSVLEANIKLLEGAIDEGRESNIGVDKARRLLKELQAQAAALEAANHLDSVMSKKPCGSGVLKSALTRAESACTSASGNSGIGSPAEFLLPRIQLARKRIEVERAAESLSKATTSCRNVADLAKLEAMILDARKVGAEELDPKVYQAASEQRSKLHTGSIVHQALDSAVKNLRKQHRQEDADAVVKALEEAKQCWELVEDEASKAEAALGQWRSLAENEAKLLKVVQEGSSAEELSKAIQEAASAGVKVQSARRILKFMQNLEASMAKAAEDPAEFSQLQDQVKAAQKGGVNSSVVSAARDLLRKILVGEAESALESVLKEREDMPIEKRCEAFRTALGKASDVVDVDLQVEPASFVKKRGREQFRRTEVAADLCTSASSKEVVHLQSLAKKVHQYLQEDECEVRRLQAERDEVERIKQKRLEEERRKEKEKEKLESERLEKERLQKEQKEKHEAERKEKEKAERERKQREKQRQERELAMQLVQDKQRRDRPRQDRFRRTAAPRPSTNKPPPQQQPPQPQPQQHSSPTQFPQEVSGQAQNYPSPSNALEASVGEFDWDPAMQQGLASPEAELTRLMDMSSEEPGFIGGAQKDMHAAGGGGDVGLIELPRSLYTGASGAAEASQAGLDSSRGQSEWVQEGGTPTLTLNGPDFSIGATRDLRSLEESSEVWALDGLRDIQAGHNAPYYGMHVDLINSLVPQSSTPWTPQTSSHDPSPTISKSLESLGIVSMESGPLLPPPHSGLSDYRGIGEAPSHQLGSITPPSAPAVPPPLSFKLNSLWGGPDAELNELRSRSSLSASHDSAAMSQYFQQSLGPEASRFREDPADASVGMGGSMLPMPGLGLFRYGSQGSRPFGTNPAPSSSPFLSVSSPHAPLSPGSTQVLPGVIRSISPNAGMAGVMPQQQHQSPFPGVGIGIPGSTNSSLTAGGNPHLRGGSVSILEAEPFVYTDEVSDESLVAQLVRRKSSRSQL
ncbi:hypothetical protein BSKO_10502 [Bryopsis sp. KO-2023]|nr:hypothetical protein BSKO_10502 [Bryopsis sp. KO-2023]